MKTDRKILLAFVLNLCFSIFEFVGGAVTGSVAIVSDAVHDLGDAAGIGVAWLLERKSKRPPDDRFTYGYARYSVLGSLMVNTILLVGSGAVIFHGAERIIHPVPINYRGMILFAVVGVIVNSLAAYFTHGGTSGNQRAVNLHMLEDVLGWVAVLAGAVVMQLTDFALLDPILSVAVAVFISYHALKNLKEVLNLFLEKTPKGYHIPQLRLHLLELEGVVDVHHIHLWSMDGESCYATMHIVTDDEATAVKERVRKELSEYGIHHATLELERKGEPCSEPHCHTVHTKSTGHHHHHH